MATIRTRLRIDERRLNTYISVISNHVAHNGAQAVAKAIRGNIRSEGLIDTGRMLDSVTIQKKTDTSTGTRYWVWPDVPYAKYQEYGTSGSTAAPGSVLVFKPKGSSSFVFTQHTAPIEAHHFIREAMKELTTADFVD